ncbi:MAG: DNA polymerase III subunit beta [Candidatus Omnitrophota bacterium]
MRLRINKEDFLNGIQTVQNVITPKNTLPILSYILIDLGNKELKLTATDLDIGISCVVPVETIEQGSISLPAKKTLDIIRELPNGNIELTTKKNNLTIIEIENCQFKIMGLTKEEFPRLPEFKDKEVLTIDQGVLKEIFNLTSFAVSHEETRYVLNGVFLKINNNSMVGVATDGKRLSLVEKNIPIKTNKEIKAIIPIKAVHEILKNLKEDEPCSMIIGNNQIFFDLNRVCVVSRLIEGEFPDYQQVVPKPSENKMKINREKLFLGIKRAALLSTPDYQAIKLEILKNKLVVSKSTPDLGESREEIDMEYQGKDLVVGFNPYYLIDVLKNIKEEDVMLEVTDSEKPGVMRLGGYLYMMMPMRLS